MSTKFNPNNAQNLPEIEKQFAVRAVEQAQAYWNLLEKNDPRTLRLTKIDDDIYEATLREFPELGEAPHEKLTKLDEEWMKSAEGKEKWRNFINLWENKITEHNFGSLLRTDAQGEYSETNTIFVTRAQFYAYEIARNRLGLNDQAHQLAKEEAEQDRLKAEREKSKKTKKTKS